MGVVCDGMGGLTKGEIASKAVIDAFHNWFKNEFSVINKTDDIMDFLINQWSFLITNENNNLIKLSETSGEQMGTTLSVLLIFNGEYYVAQVGDSRIYHCSDNNIVQVTNDHSYVMDMVNKGLMTENEARISKKRNILTRCIGVQKESKVDFFNGTVKSGDCFLISSDGFHGGTTIEEIKQIMLEINFRKHHQIEKRLNQYIDFRKNSGEKDNITAIVVSVK